MELTSIQSRALSKLDHRWACSGYLKETKQTLNRLVKMGLLDRKANPGALKCLPETTMLYRLKLDSKVSQALKQNKVGAWWI